jgi:hypothetical protein
MSYQAVNYPIRSALMYSIMLSLTGAAYGLLPDDMSDFMGDKAGGVLAPGLEGISKSLNYLLNVNTDYEVVVPTPEQRKLWFEKVNPHLVSKYHLGQNNIPFRVRFPDGRETWTYLPLDFIVSSGDLLSKARRTANGEFAFNDYFMQGPIAESFFMLATGRDSEGFQTAPPDSSLPTKAWAAGLNLSQSVIPPIMPRLSDLPFLGGAVPIDLRGGYTAERLRSAGLTWKGVTRAGEHAPPAVSAQGRSQLQELAPMSLLGLAMFEMTWDLSARQQITTANRAFQFDLEKTQRVARNVASFTPEQRQQVVQIMEEQIVDYEQALQDILVAYRTIPNELGGRVSSEAGRNVGVPYQTGLSQIRAARKALADLRAGESRTQRRTDQFLPVR